MQSRSKSLVPLNNARTSSLVIVSGVTMRRVNCNSRESMFLGRLSMTSCPQSQRMKVFSDTIRPFAYVDEHVLLPTKSSKWE